MTVSQSQPVSESVPLSAREAADPAAIERAAKAISEVVPVPWADLPPGAQTRLRCYAAAALSSLAEGAAREADASTLVGQNLPAPEVRDNSDIKAAHERIGERFPTVLRALAEGE